MARKKKNDNNAKTKSSPTKKGKTKGKPSRNNKRGPTDSLFGMISHPNQLNQSPPNLNRGKVAAPKKKKKKKHPPHQYSTRGGNPAAVPTNHHHRHKRKVRPIVLNLPLKPNKKRPPAWVRNENRSSQRQEEQDDPSNSCPYRNWLLDSISASSIDRLTNELEQLASYVRLTEGEENCRDTVLQDIEDQLSKDASIQVFGSLATPSVCTFLSDMDLILWNVLPKQPPQQPLHPYPSLSTRTPDIMTAAAAAREQAKDQSSLPEGTNPLLNSQARKQAKVAKWRDVLEQADCDHHTATAAESQSTMQEEKKEETPEQIPTFATSMVSAAPPNAPAPQLSKQEERRRLMQWRRSFRQLQQYVREGIPIPTSMENDTQPPNRLAASNNKGPHKNPNPNHKEPTRATPDSNETDWSSSSLFVMDRSPCPCSSDEEEQERVPEKENREEGKSHNDTAPQTTTNTTPSNETPSLDDEGTDHEDDRKPAAAVTLPKNKNTKENDDDLSKDHSNNQYDDADEESGTDEEEKSDAPVVAVLSSKNKNAKEDDVRNSNQSDDADHHEGADAEEETTAAAASLPSNKNADDDDDNSNQFDDASEDDDYDIVQDKLQNLPQHSSCTITSQEETIATDGVWGLPEAEDTGLMIPTPRETTPAMIRQTRPRSHSHVSLCSSTNTAASDDIDESGLEISFHVPTSNGQHSTAATATTTTNPPSMNEKTRRRVVQALNRLSKRLRKFSYAKNIHVRKKARVPIINMGTSFGFECDIGVGGHNGTDTSAYARTQCGRFASFAPVVLFLKVLLSQVDLDKPFSGGLGSYKLYVLVAYHIEQHLELGGHDSAGEVLLAFFFRYGSKFHPITNNSSIRRAFNKNKNMARTHLGDREFVRSSDGGEADLEAVFQLDNLIRTFSTCGPILHKRLTTKAHPNRQKAWPSMLHFLIRPGELEDQRSKAIRLASRKGSTRKRAAKPSNQTKSSSNKSRSASAPPAKRRKKTEDHRQHDSTGLVPPPSRGSARKSGGTSRMMPSSAAAPSIIDLCNSDAE